MIEMSEFEAVTAYVLDDDAKLRATLLNALSVHGVKASEFALSEEMLDAVRDFPPEIVILDLALEEADAIEVIRRLAVLKYLGKVLLISGHEQATIDQFQSVGERYGLTMIVGLRKPFSARELVARMASAPAIARHPPISPVVATDASVDLAAALECGWLELWYQPKVDLRTFSIRGAEALLRGRHPRHGMILPANILPTPGDPLQHVLAKFVVRQAMADWRRFVDAGMALNLSINMPVSVITTPEFISFMRNELPANSRFPGLTIEVTEDEVIKDVSLVHEAAAQLSLLRVDLAIDDFGIGYSSLSRLLDLPSLELKLDRSFVSKCASDPYKFALCRMVVELAHRVGKVVCAEGVESEDDLGAVCSMSCDMAQGYLFAKPMARELFATEVVANKMQFLQVQGKSTTAPITA